MRRAFLFVLLTGCSLEPARAQTADRTIPIAKIELGAGLSPFGVGNGMGVRGAVSFFPARVGLIARLTSHATSSGERSGLFSLGPAERRVVDRAIMLGGHVETEVDAVFTVALGVGQLWGERLSDNNSRFTTLEQKFGLAAEIGAYMPTRHSGFGTVVLTNITSKGFVVGFVLTLYAGF